MAGSLWLGPKEPLFLLVCELGWAPTRESPPHMAPSPSVIQVSFVPLHNPNWPTLPLFLLLEIHSSIGSPICQTLVSPALCWASRRLTVLTGAKQPTSQGLKMGLVGQSPMAEPPHAPQKCGGAQTLPYVLRTWLSSKAKPEPFRWWTQEPLSTSE